MPFYPHVTYLPPKRHLRLRTGAKKAFLAISADIYLLTSDQPPSSFHSFRRNSFCFPLSRGHTLVTYPFDNQSTHIHLHTPGSKHSPLILHCHSSHVSPILAQLHAALVSFHQLNSAILSFRSHPHPPALSSSHPIHPIYTFLQSITQNAKGALLLPHDISTWNDTLSTILNNTTVAVQALEQVFSSLPLVAPIFAVIGLTLDVATLQLERREQQVYLQSISPRCSAVVEDIVRALFFTLHYDVEHHVINRLVSVLERAVQLANDVERALINNQSVQLEPIADLENMVVAMRTLMYVQHDFNQKRDLFHRAMLVQTPGLAVCAHDQSEMRQLLLSQVMNEGGLFALQGLSATGKTILIRQVANEKKAATWFEGGVYMTSLKNDVRNSLKQWVESSGGASLANQMGTRLLAEVVQMARQWFYGRRCLFVFDDAKDSAVVRELCGIADVNVGAAVVFVARGNTVVHGVVSEKHILKMDKCRDVDARKIVYEWMGEDWEKMERERETMPYGHKVLEIEKVVKDCNGIRGLLAAAGVMMKRNVREDICRYALEETFGNSFDGFTTGMQEVMQGLEESVRKRAELVCLVRPGEWAPVQVVQEIWQVDEGEAAEIVNALQQENLVMVDKKGRVWVETIVHAYLKHVWHKEGKYEELHRGMVAKDVCDDEWWDRLQMRSGWERDYVGWHLVQGGMMKELEKVLFDFRWIDTRVSAGEVERLLGDYEGCEGEENVGNDLRHALGLLVDAVRLSYGDLKENGRHSAFQMQGRLQGQRGNAHIDQLLQSITNHGESGRLESLGSVLHGAGGDLKGSVRVGWGIHKMCEIPLSETVVVAGDGGAAVVNMWTQSVRMLEKGRAWSVAQANGKVAVGWQDGRVQIYAAEKEWNKEEEWDVSVGWQKVKVCVGFFGKDVVTGSEDGRVCRWREGKLQREYKAGKKVTDVKVHKGVIYVAEEMRIRIIKEEGEEREEVFPDSFLGLQFVQIVDEKIVTGDEGRNVVTIENGNRRYLKGSQGYILCATGGDNGKLIAGGMDKKITIWNNRHELISTLHGHTDSITGIACTTQIVSSSRDGTLKLWNNNNHTISTPISNSHTSTTTCLSIHPTQIITGSTDGTLIIWQRNTAYKLWQTIAQPRPVTSIHINNNQIAAGFKSGLICIWSTLTKQLIQQPKIQHRGAVTSILLHNNSIISGGQDNLIYISQNNTTLKLSGHKNHVVCLALVHQTQTLLSAALDKQMRVWDFKTGVMQRVIKVGSPRRLLVKQQGVVDVFRAFGIANAVFDYVSGEELCADVQEQEKVVKVVLGRREIWFGNVVVGCFEDAVTVEERQGDQLWVGLDNGLVGCIKMF